MSAKKRTLPRGFDIGSVTMEHLIEAFERMRSQSQLQRTDADKGSPGLPRVPYKVEQIESKSPNEIAHFVRHYKDPAEVIGKLSLVRPDFRQTSRATKKPSGS